MRNPFRRRRAEPLPRLPAPALGPDWQARLDAAPQADRVKAVARVLAEPAPAVHFLPDDSPDLACGAALSPSGRWTSNMADVTCGLCACGPVAEPAPPEPPASLPGDPATARLLDAVLAAKPLKPGEGPKVHYLPAITAGKCTARPASPDHAVSDTGAVNCGTCRRTVLYKTAARGQAGG